MPRQYATVADRFWSKVAKVDGEGCWLWQAGQNRHGYGAFYLNGRNHPAPRIAYELTYGPIPEGMLACHRCDNPQCVRPDHLFLGDTRANAVDMVAKGRSAVSGDRHWIHEHPERAARGDRNGSRMHPERVARGERHGSHVHPERVLRGEGHGRAKVTETQVREMRQRYQQGETLKELGAEYGVHFSVVSDIVNRKSWRHVA